MQCNLYHDKAAAIYRCRNCSQTIKPYSPIDRTHLTCFSSEGNDTPADIAKDAGPPNPSSVPGHLVKCKYRGDENGAKLCTSCRGSVKIKTFECSVFGECTLYKDTGDGKAVCYSCKEYQPALRLSFDHGLGDAVQATSLVRQLRRSRPSERIVIKCRPGQESLFLAAGSEIEMGGDDFEPIKWAEPSRSIGLDTPSTKLESCLLDEFLLQPDPEGCRYELSAPDEMIDRARAILGGRCIFIQWYGSSLGSLKNLDETTVAEIASLATSCGLLPLIWNPDRIATPMLDKYRSCGEEIVREISRTPTDAQAPDAMGLAALLAACDRIICIDSGPGIMSQALSNSGQGRPTLVVWTEHHPVHYACPSKDATHLVPDDHHRFIHQRQESGAEFFEKNYTYRTYSEKGEIAGKVFAWISDSWHGSEENRLASPSSFGGSGKCFQFIVPMGIGDVSWVYSKIRHLKSMTGRETILYCPAADAPKRGGDLIELLPDVHWGGYIGDEDSQSVLSQSLPANWPAKMGTWEFLGSKYRRRLAANMHLESGRKLDEWLPCLPTDYHYTIGIPGGCLSEADDVMKHSGPRPIAVYISGRDKDEAIAGGWSLWKEQEWIDFLVDVANTPEASGATFVFIGAEYDRDKTEAVASAIEDAGHGVRRVISRPLGVALECLRRCSYSFCYPSGIGILANVLRVPGVMLLPWSLADLAETYADPCDIAARRYRAWPDPKPDEVLDWCLRSSWPGLEWK